jgi:hypothetical protein
VGKATIEIKKYTSSCSENQMREMHANIEESQDKKGGVTRLNGDRHD